MIRRLLKRLRAFGPVNRPATATVRWILDRLGVRPPFVVRHLHRHGEVRHRLPNGRRLVIWSLADDGVSNDVYWHGWSGFEPEMSPLFFVCCRNAGAGVVLDVGAHVGYYTLLAGHASAGLRVFAFEPHPLTFQRLQENVARNGLTNVRCMRAAVGANSGHSDYFFPQGGIPATASLSEDFMTSLVPADRLERAAVDTVAIDEFLSRSDAGRVRIVKLDVDTGEPAVLRGMRQTLLRDRPVIFCEVLPEGNCEGQLQAALEPLGYRFYLLHDDGPVIQGAIRGHRACRNYLFTTAEPDAVCALWEEATRIARRADRGL